MTNDGDLQFVAWALTNPNALTVEELARLRRIAQPYVNQRHGNRS
jgi:hypothetical protein